MSYIFEILKRGFLIDGETLMLIKDGHIETLINDGEKLELCESNIEETALNNEEIKLIKEALTNNAVKYMSDSEEFKKEMGEQWSKKTKKKSDSMIALLNKIQ